MNAALQTPVGRIVVTAGSNGIRRVAWRAGAGTTSDPEPGSVLASAVSQLAEYFAGTRRSFEVPVDLGELEPATRQVLLALQRIPYGHSVTYGELAELSGTGLPARAIGSVMGANPIPILIGCHRVLAGDGLGGYSGGPPGQSLETKRWLLELEGILPPRLL
ncbi:MAG TPA: methylated-DNA--[protein]-cysteine S-methyltransferase [Microlunatus sp.]|nr:methylated-DNA--[protein]-cysteine S-methyltransferase [Microlunatus sp.]